MVSLLGSKIMKKYSCSLWVHLSFCAVYMVFMCKIFAENFDSLLSLFFPGRLSLCVKSRGQAEEPYCPLFDEVYNNIINRLASFIHFSPGVKKRKRTWCCPLIVLWCASDLGHAGFPLSLGLAGLFLCVQPLEDSRAIPHRSGARKVVKMPDCFFYSAICSPLSS